MKSFLSSLLVPVAFIALLGRCHVMSAFVLPNSLTRGTNCATLKQSFVPSGPFQKRHRERYVVHSQPVALRRQRRSAATVATMSLFGLGAPEIIIILVAVAFVLGPQKLADLGKDAGKMAGELKEVPKEFQKGLEEGEAEARSKKAKLMEKPPTEE